MVSAQKFSHIRTG